MKRINSLKRLVKSCALRRKELQTVLLCVGAFPSLRESVQWTRTALFPGSVQLENLPHVNTKFSGKLGLNSLQTETQGAFSKDHCQMLVRDILRMHLVDTRDARLL